MATITAPAMTMPSPFASSISSAPNPQPRHRLPNRAGLGLKSQHFAEILATGGPYDLPYDVPTPSELIALVRDAGGVPVLAHPFASVRGATLTEQDIADLAAVGLMGLEVDHRDHTEDDRVRLRALARDLNLLVTGSSDFHGAGKRNRLGENVTSPEVFAALEAAGYLEVIR